MRDRANQPLAVVCIAKDITAHKRAEEQNQHNLKRMTALYDINLMISSTLELAPTLEALLEKIDLLLPSATAITVKVFNEEVKALEIAASRNLDAAEWRGDKWKSGRDLAQLVFETKSPMLVNNVQTNPGIENPEFYKRHGWVSFLGIPLAVNEKTLGVLSFYTMTVQRFAKEDVEFLNIIAGFAAMAIHNSSFSPRADLSSLSREGTMYGKH